MQPLTRAEVIMGVTQVEHRQGNGREHLVQGHGAGFADKGTAQQHQRDAQQPPAPGVGRRKAIHQDHDQRRGNGRRQPGRKAGDLAQGQRQQPGQQR